MSMTTKLRRVMTYHEGILPIKSHRPLISWPSVIIWHNKIIISPLTLFIWLPNFAGWWLTRWAPAIKSHETTITQLCKIMWQNKIIISQLPQYLWLSNLAGWWLTIRDSYPQSHMTHSSGGFASSRDKLKTYPLSRRPWPPKLAGWWQPWGVPTRKFTKLFDHVVWWDHVPN